MKMLSSEITKLLDKLYNLRGDDSVVLVSMDKEREAAEQTRDRTSQLKTQLQNKIGELTAEETVLADEGEKLVNALSNIKKSEFATVIDHLRIDFDPDAIKKKVETTLPMTLDKVAGEKKKAGEELLKVEDEMNEAITKIEELGIRKDEALASQERLNNYFDLALSSNINITRDEITSLLSSFEFTEEEQREAAKLLMFPEDGLFLYDKAFKGRTYESLLEVGDVQIGEQENLDVIVDTPSDEQVVLSADTAEDIAVIEEDPMDLMIEGEKISLEEAAKRESEVPTSEGSNANRETLVDTLTKLGFDYLDFTNNDFTKMEGNFDAELYKKNVAVVEKVGIDKDIFLDNVELLYDLELEGKIDKLTGIGKLPQDIYLNPSVLVKYNLKELDNAIKTLHESGLEPKNVPLMAY